MNNFVFICCTQKDYTFAGEVTEYFQRQGTAVLLQPSAENAGVGKYRCAEDAIADCCCMLVIMSDSAVRSDSVARLCLKARLCEKPVIMLNTEDFEKQSKFSLFKKSKPELSNNFAALHKAVTQVSKHIPPAKKKAAVPTPSDEHICYRRSATSPAYSNPDFPRSQQEEFYKKAYEKLELEQRLASLQQALSETEQSLNTPQCAEADYGEAADDWDSGAPADIQPETPREQAVTLSKVDFSAVAPKQFLKGGYSMVDITVYEEQYRHIVDDIISNSDISVFEKRGSPAEIGQNTAITVSLSSPDLELPDCRETQYWHGSFASFSFAVYLPDDYRKRQILFFADIYFNGVIATKIKFLASCSSYIQQKMEITRNDILTGFISYASGDRDKVATIIQGMKKARPDMDIFFDIESLRSGELWENTLMREIENRDLLFLCWSPNAKASPWVEKEWKFALNTKGVEAIEPIPLVSPAECPPPPELSTKHFNDKALFYTAGTK